MTISTRVLAELKRHAYAAGDVSGLAVRVAALAVVVEVGCHVIVECSRRARSETPFWPSKEPSTIPQLLNICGLFIGENSAESPRAAQI